MADPLLTLDPRGRVTIGKHIRKNGIEPSPLYALSFGPYQTLTLTPVSVVPTAAQNEGATS